MTKAPKTLKTNMCVSATLKGWKHKAYGRIINDKITMTRNGTMPTAAFVEICKRCHKTDDFVRHFGWVLPEVEAKMSTWSKPFSVRIAYAIKDEDVLTAMFRWRFDVRRGEWSFTTKDLCNKKSKEVLHDIFGLRVSRSSSKTHVMEIRNAIIELSKEQRESQLYWLYKNSVA